MMNNLKKLSLIIIIFFFSNEIYSQFTPFFQNHSLTKINAGSQNWDISFAENGKIYVANNNGLAEFDGLKWSLFQLPNKTIVRSVLAYNDVIYTGSYGEFGFWKKNNKGELIYFSLSNSSKSNDELDEQFWQILAFKEGILFRSFSNLYIYKNEKLVKISKSTILSCDIVEDKVYVSTLKDGVFLLENERLVPFLNESAIPDFNIISISKFKNNLLITTALKGCFLLENGKLTPWNPPINQLLKLHQLNNFIRLEDNKMAFGTIKNGIFITNEDGEVLYHINKENGLLNNTVLSQGLEKSKKLWLGLDYGIATIDLNYNHILYKDITGELGAVYDIINYNNTLYLGSNTGLFYVDEKEQKIKFIENSQGQVWNLKEINGDLFCGHNNGTFLVKNKMLKKISNLTGGWIIKKVPEEKNTFIQGTYNGLVKYEYINDKWETKRIQGISIPVKFLVFEDQHIAWIAHAYRGLYRIVFDDDYENITIKNYKDKGLSSDFNVKIHRIKNDICFKTNEGWKKYEPLLDSIVFNKLLNKKFGRNTSIISESDNDIVVTKNSKDKISFISLSNGNSNFELPDNLFKEKLIVDGESISLIKDSTYALNLYDGFMLIHKSKQVSTNDTLLEPVIEKFEIDKNLIALKPEDLYQLPFNKSISISISSPKSTNYFFQYAFSNSDSLIWYDMSKAKLELSSLVDGDYTVYFRASNQSGDYSSVKSIKLEVLPPWYKNTFVYLITVMCISAIIYWFHRKKIKKEQELLQTKLLKEQERLFKEKAVENDKKIVELKNNSLKNEVKLKSKQLANTAMALVKKNESIVEIKIELLKNQSLIENSSIYKRLLRKIDNSISQEGEWELFEYNFNQVHEEFFNQLKSKHPKLTHKDLKTCAYIKMNLLTKEIAPLMNISIRGLETHRYRLKSKLNLKNDKSIVDYLRNFK